MHTEFNEMEITADQATPTSWIRVQWLVPIAVMVVTLMFAYFGFIRPANHQMARLQRQVNYLQGSIDQLTGQGAAAAEANHLLQQLSEQAFLTDQGAQTLTQIQQLHERLSQEASQLADATQAIDQLAQLRDDVQHNTALIQQTADVLTAMEDLQSQILDSTEITAEAQEISDGLLAMNEQIVERGENVEIAHSTLEHLISIRRQLDQQTGDLDLAEQRVTGLLELKDNVLARTENLVSAIETFERAIDLQDQFEEASQSFQEIRHMLAEMVMLRPGIAQAMNHLEPLTDLVNLRRLSSDDIRHMAQSLVDRRREQIAARTPSGSLETDVTPPAAAAEFTSARAD